MSGWPTKGSFACPVCRKGTCSEWLQHSRKFAYMGHRRFLALNHPFRKKRTWFNGEHEKGVRPKLFTGEEIFLEVENFVNDWGKAKKKRKRKEKEKDSNSEKLWKKRSVFFNLPYWKTLLVRHNLDVMHIEKNICDSIIGTLLDIKGKSKDGLNSRQDLECMGIRKELHPENRGSKYYLPAASHTLSKEEKKIFCKRLVNLKLPDGYGSDIRKCISVAECKIMGLKSHDCHMLMQQLLSVALRGLLPKGPRNAIYRLSSFFNELCKRVIYRNILEKLEEDVVETLCMLERFFPPFFDIMVHLTIHLGRESRLCGPVQYRWMYPMERYMKVIKGYVKNRARPEGCIAERYLAEECTVFCSKYIKQVAEVGARHAHNEEFENELLIEERTIKHGKLIILPNEMLQVAHLYILLNTSEVQPYIEMHLDELRSPNRRLSRNETLLQKKHTNSFSAWFKKKIECQMRNNNVSKTLQWLAKGPREQAKSYFGFLINNVRFHIQGAKRSRQNSGVSVEAYTPCRASAKDNSQVIGKIWYYGVLREILVLDYNMIHVPIFKCDWANIVNGVKIDDGFTLVNLHEGQSQFKRDPFILASQAKQVFYSRE